MQNQNIFSTERDAIFGQGPKRTGGGVLADWLLPGCGDGLDEKQVDAAVAGELGMEGGGQDTALANKDGEAVALGEYLDAGADFDDARGADEDHLQRASGQSCFGGNNGGVDLAAVGVALDDGIEDAEAALRRVQDFAGQENGARAGAEDGLFGAELLQGFKEAVLGEKFEHGGGFAAGQHEAIKAGELSGLADLDGRGAGLGECFGMAGEVALDGEYADDGRFRYRQCLS